MIKMKIIKAENKTIYEIVFAEIKKLGYNADLNHIDVSKVTKMNSLFSFNNTVIKFDGDISKWNVSNVTTMFQLFYNSNFNGNIDSWDLSKLKDADLMFRHSKRTNDLGKIKFHPNVSDYLVLDGSDYTGEFNTQQYFKGSFVDTEKLQKRYNIWVIKNDCK